MGTERGGGQAHLQDPSVIFCVRVDGECSHLTCCCCFPLLYAVFIPLWGKRTLDVHVCGAELRATSPPSCLHIRNAPFCLRSAPHWGFEKQEALTASVPVLPCSSLVSETCMVSLFQLTDRLLGIIRPLTLALLFWCHDLN